MCVRQLSSLSVKYLKEMTCLMSWPCMATQQWPSVDLGYYTTSLVLLCANVAPHTSPRPCPLQLYSW